MKKLKTLLSALLATGGLTAAAEPFTVTVTPDDVTHVYCCDSKNYSQRVEPVDGKWVFELENETTQYCFYPEDNYLLESVTAESGTTEIGTFEDTYWYAKLTQADNFTIKTLDLEASRTASFTCIVDDASKVSLQRQDYTSVSLENGENTVKFNPSLETQFTIGKAYGAKDPYQVTQNGTVIEMTYGYYYITPHQDDVINIQTAYPDVEATITFKYNQGGEGCISNLRIDNELVADFDGKSIKAKLGSSLTFDRADNWNISSYTLNGVTSTNFYNYSGTVKGDMDFEFIAQYDDPRVTFYVTVDDATHVKATTGYGSTTLPLHDGENTIKVDQYSSVQFEGVAPYAIKEVINLADNSTQNLSSGKWSKYVYASDQDSRYQITTYNLEESRTATATFTVDNPAKILLRRASDYATIELKEGSNTVKFNPETETVFSLSSNTNVPLWEVKMNGETLTDLYGTYNLTLTDGCTVDITANLPDIDITATFDITDEDAAENFITSVKVEGEEVEFNGTSVSMKAGQSINLTFNSLYKLDSFQIGESTENIYGSSYNKLLMEDTKFTIKAHKLSTVKVTIVVDDPENVTVANGSNMYYDPTVLTLQAGSNEVELPENNLNICWKVNAGAELISVKRNDDDINLDYYSSTVVVEGDVITFTTQKINYDKTAVIWVDNFEAATNYFSLGGSYYADDRTTVKAATGYTVFNFRDKMLPMDLSWYGDDATVGKVYINNEYLAPQYENSTSHQITTLADGDVIKVFLSTEPKECELTFDVEEGLEVSATTDRIVPVADFTAPLTVFAGTEVALTIGSEGNFVVMNGENAITPDEEGNYLVTVNDPTAISVSQVKGNLTLALSDTALTIATGETATLTATTEKDDDVTVASEEWTTSDATVATVDNGTVTAVAPGTATITLTVTDNYGRTFDATCAVTVTDKSGIKAIEAGAANGATIYDVQGRRVNKAGKGIYIVNGKAVKF